MNVLTREERRIIDKFMGKHIGQPNIVSMYNDYNSIMKVIEKIESLGCDATIRKNACSIVYLDPSDIFLSPKTIGFSNEKTKFESMCKACLMAIKSIED